MHDYDVPDSKVLVHVSVAFYASVYSICSGADACWFACIRGSFSGCSWWGINDDHVVNS